MVLALGLFRSCHLICINNNPSQLSYPHNSQFWFSPLCWDLGLAIFAPVEGRIIPSGRCTNLRELRLTEDLRGSPCTLRVIERLFYVARENGTRKRVTIFWRKTKNVNMVSPVF